MNTQRRGYPGDGYRASISRDRHFEPSPIEMLARNKGTSTDWEEQTVHAVGAGKNEWVREGESSMTSYRTRRNRYTAWHRRCFCSRSAEEQCGLYGFLGNTWWILLDICLCSYCLLHILHTWPTMSWRRVRAASILRFVLFPLSLSPGTETFDERTDPRDTAKTLWQTSCIAVASHFCLHTRI